MSRRMLHVFTVLYILAATAGAEEPGGEPGEELGSVNATNTDICKWTLKKDTSLAGWLSAPNKKRMNLLEAKAKCLEVGSDCHGVTCAGLWYCTVRGGIKSIKLRTSTKKEQSYVPSPECYSSKATPPESHRLACAQACRAKYGSIKYPELPLTACNIGCQYFLKGYPDYYLGEKDLKKGEGKNIDRDLPKGPTDYWKGLDKGSYLDCKEACSQFMCVSDTFWRRDESAVCREPRFFATSFAIKYCAAGCLSAAKVQYGDSVTKCALAPVSKDCQCDEAAPTNECIKGRVCTVVYGERTCHKSHESAERNVKDEFEACKANCAKSYKGGWDKIGCEVGCRYLLIGPPASYVGPEQTAAETHSKPIKAGPTDYWIGLERYSLKDCKQACDNFMCAKWTGENQNCTTAVHWASGKFHKRCRIGCEHAAKEFWGTTFEACPSSTTSPVKKHCRCDAEEDSVDCLAGRYCFEGKCRTQWKVSKAIPSDCNTDCGRPKWTIFGTVTCRGNENAWRNLCMMEKPRTPKFVCPATKKCACTPDKVGLPPGTQPKGYPRMLPSGDSILPKSGPNMLLTLMRIDVDTCHTVQVARSYSGYEWEGVAPSPLHPACGSSGCKVKITDKSFAYRIDATSRAKKPDATILAARFLEQSTFGASPSDLKEFASKYATTGLSGISKWMDEQVAKKPSLHRAYYRRRANPRADQKQMTGLVIGPCDAKSRWHRFAFTIADEGKVLKIARSASKDNMLVLSIDGLVRTEVPDTWGFSPYYMYGRNKYRSANIKRFIVANVQACQAACAKMKDGMDKVCKYFSYFNYVTAKKGLCLLSTATATERKGGGWNYLPIDFKKPDTPIGEYTVQRVSERTGGPLHLCTASYNKKTKDCKAQEATNPVIRFSVPDKEATQVYSALVGSDVLTAMLPKRDSPLHPKSDVPDVYIMKQPRKDCQKHLFKAGSSFIGFATSKTDSTLQFYKHDPRLRLLDNTLDSPADISADRDAGTFGLSSAQVQCPLLEPNFLNERKCVRHTEGTCSPLEFNTNKQVKLDQTNLRLWYTTSHKHVLAVDGLSPDSSPCTPRLTSRWRLVSGKCKGGPSLDAATKKTLVTALQKQNKMCDDIYSKLPEDERSYSSVWGVTYTAGYGNARSRIDSHSAWIAGKKEAGEWMQFDFGEPRTVVGAVVQPRRNSVHHVKTYKVTYSVNGKDWKNVPGEYDGLKKEKKTSFFPAPFSAQYVRLVVIDWEGHPAMRADILVCRFGDSKNAFIRDIVVSNMDSGTCSKSKTIAGARIQVTADTCWQHVHSDTLNVYDFAGLSVKNCRDFLDEPERNKINAVAESGSYVYEYTGTAADWKAIKKHVRYIGKGTKVYTLKYVGRFGDSVAFEDFDPDLQTIPMADALGVKSSKSTVAFDACGSRAEVANDPLLGNRLFFTDDRCFDELTKSHTRQLDMKHSIHRGKEIVFTNLALKSSDQLRQRVAWALSQVFVISEQGLPNNNQEMASYLSYYDILVSNAFGNYRDILKEVAYHPLMGIYLTYYGNKALGYTKSTFPDENFAREFMQLFSIGLLNVNLDGSLKLTAEKNEIPTYDNDHIMASSRVWTGFTRGDLRGNKEKPYGNPVDPMNIKYDWHDFLPKVDLKGGHLADGYPLCADHPRAFLAKGARYRYTGDSSAEDAEYDLLWTTSNRPRFSPKKTSNLFKALCKRDSRTGKCTFPSLVVLPKTLPCDGPQECKAENVRVVKIVDGDQFGYFTHLPPSCARLTFFDGVMTYAPEAWTKHAKPQCTDPTSTVVAGAACCGPLGDLYNDWGESKCLFALETMSLKTAQERCAKDNSMEVMKVCEANVFSRKKAARKYSCADNGYIWTTEPCQLRVKVFSSGKVTIVSPGSVSTKYGDRHGITRFMVHWEPTASGKGSRYPTVDSGCGEGCKVDKADGGSCLCGVKVTDTPAYTDIKKIPTADKLLSSLFIGAPAPSNEPGVYTQCKTCAKQAGVTVYIRGSSGSAAELKETALFAIDTGKGKMAYLMNRVSMVGVGSSADGKNTLFHFRNPPNLMPGVGEVWPTTVGWNRHKLRKDMVTNEIDALISHVFYHDNTAVFVARKLIMRLVTSNPSPRYIKTAATAFTTGTYNGRTFSGQYGDMKATVYAVLLDREARISMIEYDMTFGRVREPLLKLLGVMRALEYVSRDEREVYFKSLDDRIGQQVFQSETVFNFYDDDFDSLGPMFAAGLVAPESQLLTAPQTVSWANGLLSLVKFGLSDCENGFLNYLGQGQECYNVDIAVEQSAGWLTFTPTSPKDPAATLKQLSLLLTSGRLTPQHSSVIQQAYAQVLKAEGKKAALQRAVKLILFSAEFHSTAMNTLVPGKRPAGPPEASHDRKFKAVVVLFLAGGADSYNLLVPHSECKGAVDLYKEYESVRGPNIAIPKDELHQIKVPAGNQPCNVMGIHPDLKILKDLYDDGDAVMFANMGAMVEPVTKEEFLKKKKRLPPGLFAHNLMQKSAQTVEAQNGSAQGILARMFDALRRSQSSPPHKSNLFSLAGSKKILSGSKEVIPSIVSPRGGIARINSKDLKVLKNDIDKILGYSHSLMAETYSTEMENIIKSTEEMGPILSKQPLVSSDTWEKAQTDVGRFSEQLLQVAKLIQISKKEQFVERSGFVTQMGGFDTHNDYREIVNRNFKALNVGLKSFVNEMKAQEVWDDVVVVAVSDFGRKIRPNGRGTDHAWGGNYFVLGGGLRGGQVLGEYPSRLDAQFNPLDVRDGRMIPTTPWEAVWHGIAQWLDIEERLIPDVLPNVKNFAPKNIFTRWELFNESPPASTKPPAQTKNPAPKSTPPAPTTPKSTPAPKSTPPAPTTPKSTPSASKCGKTCKDQTCDYWSSEEQYTCDQLKKEYGCDCSGCECKIDKLLVACEEYKYKGDGNCDDGNNNAGCYYDGGDCCEKSVGGSVKKDYCKECKCLDPNPKAPKPPACGEEKYKGDGNCDDENNNAGCEFDGGDCCEKSVGKAVSKEYCKECKCLDPNPKATTKPACGNKEYKGDGNCDDDNNNAGCEFDGGDCCAKSLGKAVSKEYCKECKCLDPNPKAPTKPACGNKEYKGDGNCDDDNNNEGCDFDGGDCCAKSVGGTVKKTYCKECKCLDPNPKAPAKPACGNKEYKGDGNCDDENNNAGCDFDGGDCCAKSLGKAVSKDYCKECKCLDPNPKAPKPTCGNKEYKGDGNCDDDNNNAGCEFDGGDCCAKSVGGSVKKDYCKECKCLDPNPKATTKPECGNKEYKGDGNCDDDNNNAGCEFDGGDCCAKSLGGSVKKDYCKECKCLDPNPKAPHACGLKQYKGDGNCDDENNNAGCDYDGGDCCEKSLGGTVKKDYCKECKCLDPKSK